MYIRRQMLVGLRRGGKLLITSPGTGQIRIGNYLYYYRQSLSMTGDKSVINLTNQFNQSI